MHRDATQGINSGVLACTHRLDHLASLLRMDTTPSDSAPYGRPVHADSGILPPLTSIDLQNIGSGPEYGQVHLGEPIVDQHDPATHDGTDANATNLAAHTPTLATEEPYQQQNFAHPVDESFVKSTGSEKAPRSHTPDFTKDHKALEQQMALKQDEELPKLTFMQRVSNFFKGNADALEQERINKELQEKLWADPAPFRFKPGQLCSLIDPEDYEALREMGGVNGLLAGVGSNPETGITPDTSAQEGKYMGTVADRERVYGRNILPERKSKSLLTLMWLALQDKILIVLIVAAIVSLALGFYSDFGQEQRVPCLHPDEGETDCEAPKVDWVEGVAILVAVLIVDLVGSLNDWQKERQFRTLDAKKEARDVTVLRSGTKHQVDVHDVLVGDIVSFEPGEVLAFDGVVLRGHNIKCDESSATGESDMISKLPFDEYTKELDNATGPLKHKSCFMISGSKVLEGVGEFVVTAVGPMSFNGKLMMSLREEPENTPLQTKLNHMAELIAKLGTSAGLILFIALMIRYFVQLGIDKDDGTPTLDASKYGRKFIDILIISVTIIVVAVPEGLPLAVTLALAFATRRMSNRNLLVRILGSCETMANATCVCTDKTGTLTQNKMNVVAGCIGCDLQFQDKIKFEVDNSAPSDDLVVMEDMSSQLPSSVRKLLTDSICINSTAFIPDQSDPVEEEEEPVEKPWYVKLFSSSPKKVQVAEPESPFIGSKTETALLAMVINLNWGDYALIRKAAQVVQMIPFGSKRKSMGVVIKTDHGYRFLLKGASEVLLGLSTRTVALHGQAANGEIPTLPIDDALRTNLEDTIKGYASQSLRTISLCYRDFESWPPPNAPTEEGEVKYEFLAQEMTLLGITAIEDPLRNGVPEAVRACGRAGVQVKMCTGDNILTARSIATQCGIFKPGGIVIEGPAFRQLSDDELTEVAPRIQVLARSSPDDKKKLIDKLKSLGEVVAVTGDGTNDGPALKAANVGFSMGIAGSEVAKEASDIILLDDNFSSIVNAIMWGRCVNDAVRKFLQFQFTVNIVAVIVTFVSAIASDSENSVLTAVQLLWLNLIMDTLAALALATDPADESSLDRKPDRSSAPLVTTEMWKHIVVQSVYQIIVILVLNFRGAHILHYEHEGPGPRARDHLIMGALIFNTFVWCQLFNQVNARRLDRKFNIFHNMHKNLWFILIILIEIGAQVLIMFIGGATFSVIRLHGREWGISIVAGFISWPLGILTRLCPTEPIERALISMRLMPDPNALPTLSQEARDLRPVLPDNYSDWNEPTVGRLAKELGAYSRIRGGRLRASNLVLKSNKRLMRDQDIHPQSLLAIVPAFIGASVGGGWRPAGSRSASQQSDVQGTTTAKALFEQGKLQFHPDTPEDNPYLSQLKGGYTA